MTVSTYRPTPGRRPSRKTWRSPTTGITLPLDPEGLTHAVGGLSGDRLRLISGDLAADLLALKDASRAHLKHLADTGSPPAHQAAERHRLSRRREAMQRLRGVVEAELLARKKAAGVDWPKLFLRVARRDLDPQLFASLSEEAERLQMAMLAGELVTENRQTGDVRSR